MPGRTRERIPSFRLRVQKLEDRLAPSTSIPLNSISWTPLGPAPIISGISNGGIASSGRTSAVVAHPTDANILYVGAASGGVWKTTNATATNPTWTPLTDAQAVLTTGDIAMAPTNPNILYVATGEHHNSGDSYYGRGVLRSTDAGATWTMFDNGGTFVRKTMSRVVVHPTNPDIVFVAVHGSGTNGLSGNTGIYRTTNGGTTWTNLTTAITTTAAFTDFELDGTNPHIGYCAIGTRAGNAANGIYKTTNLLDPSPTWSLVPGLASGTGNGRTLLAISPTDPLVLYTVIVNPSNGSVAGFAQTTDGGATWISRSPPNFTSSQGWYDVYIVVDPTNPNTVIAGGAAGSNRLIRSTNGGSTWSSLVVSGSPAPHVDHHNATFDALGRLIDVDDGGIYRLNSMSPITWVSLNGVGTVPNPSALNTNQFVGIAIHPTNANLAIGGTQDNGTLRFNDNTGWATVEGGDGGDVLYDPFNSNTLYRVSPVGSFGSNSFMRKSTNGGQTFSSITSGIVNASSAQFYPPIIADPSTANRVFLGTNVVNVTTNGSSWSRLGAALPSSSSIRSLGIGAASASTLYVGSNSGDVYVTTNNGGVWNTRTPAGGDAFNDFAVDPTNSNIAYVVSASFTGATRIWRTIDAGVNWTSIQGDLPNLPTFTVLLDPGHTPASSDDVLYIGNDRGVYRSANFTDPSPNWTRFGLGLPNVVVRDLELAPALGILAAGTYGRGVWQIQTSPVAPPEESIGGTQFNDLDADGVFDGNEPGLPGWTVYLDANDNAQFDPILFGPTSFPSTNVPLALPDLSATISTLDLSNVPGVITKITLTLNITHTFDGDLVIDLISPSGQIVNLCTSVGGNGQNFTNTTFDDAAAIPITAGSAPFAGSFQPQQLLSTFNGRSANGAWSLRITDVGPGDIGTLNSWSLRITTGENSRVTDSNGEYIFTDLAPGTYRVREIAQPGWIRTLPAAPADSYLVTITAGGPAVVDRDFGVTQSIPPTVTNVVIGDATPNQRSMITSLRVIFSDLIQYVGAATDAYTLSKQSGGTVSLSVKTVTVGNHIEAILSFLSDTQFGSLVDGRYTLTVHANQIQNLAGTNMTSNSTTQFHRYYGDVNGDAQVDGLDFSAFSSTFNLMTGNAAFLGYLDVNGDGVIDGFDFSQFSGRFNTVLP
jgi:subtilisin-like proprotein convertase family protein